jgi:alanine racemase
MTKPNTYLEIDLAAIRQNVLEIKKRIHPRVLAVVKSNAYGHGAVEVVKALNDLVVGFMVDNVSEAMEIKAVATQPILVMLANRQDDIEVLTKNKIAFALFDFYQLAIIKAVSEKLSRPINVHLKIDTGMNRLGFKERDWLHLEKELAKHQDYLKITGIFSHFVQVSDVEASTSQQVVMKKALEFFKENLGEDCLSHFSASDASVNYGQSNCEALRPGALLYGYNSNPVSWLKPALALKTHIVQLKWIEPGEAVGYDRLFKPVKKTLIGIMPVGYKDNFSRRMTFVNPKGIIDGQIYPVVGRVCMRFSFIDVTKIADKIKVGETVTLLGKENQAKIDASDWAEKLDTTFYEILAQFPRDLPRIYLK